MEQNQQEPTGIRAWMQAIAGQSERHTVNWGGNRLQGELQALTALEQEIIDIRADDILNEVFGSNNNEENS